MYLVPSLLFPRGCPAPRGASLPHGPFPVPPSKLLSQCIPPPPHSALLTARDQLLGATCQDTKADVVHSDLEWENLIFLYGLCTESWGWYVA